MAIPGSDLILPARIPHGLFVVPDVSTPSYADDPGSLASSVVAAITPIAAIINESPVNSSLMCLANSTLNSSICAKNLTTALPQTPHVLPHSLWLTIFLAIVVGIISFVTIIGNITVLLAFGLERTIRQPTNYFLASLAVSDLLIGTFSMPLYTQYLLWGKWPLGPWLCDLWLSLDWTVCLTSQYTVFLITMDRFLSVKIPAKYRNWRSERKVIVMLSITWVFPAMVFFTSIIGWQYFVGKRTVDEGECEVQFMEDTMFTFLLTIGYYWITLVVMCALYGGIYKVALDLQRKSDAKHKKMQSTMELAGDNPNAAIRNFANDAEGGSNNSSCGGDSQAHSTPQNNVKNKKNNRKSVKAALPRPPGAQIVNTTSFSTDKLADKDDDRSSSPAFASDEENSSSGGTATAPGKSPVPSNKSQPPAAIVNNIHHTSANTVGLVRSLHADLLTSAKANLRENQKPINMPQHYSKHEPKPTSDTGSDTEGGGPHGCNSVYSSSQLERIEKQTTPLLQNEINKGCRFIDEKSFLATLNSENSALLPVSAGESEFEDSDILDFNNSSPIWKRRNSLPPLASDVFDIEDNISDCLISTDFMITTDFPAVSKPPQMGFTKYITDELRPRADTANTLTSLTTPAETLTDDSSGNKSDVGNPNDNSDGHNNNVVSSPNAPPSDTNDDSSSRETHCLAAVRRRREKDTRLHTFVKSVRSRNSKRRNRRERKSKSENRARKALRTISFILGAFVLCWTPYHVAIMIKALCDDCVNDHFYSFSYWLCYLNSPINPFCYAFANAQFKRTFLRIMRFDWHRT